ncbi:hypothetical protein [Micromonospora sp. WMMD998]|uniref:hypothetical protein n=1 Tax=Micromonospora sp. WMMD998 TaxID=3016092 RepID=UPI00249A5C57|nr:hypothetical protein [Micromonospora sp. WMMD998]WFE38712.1 hypothetical protein O7619_09835 [Micromonospora sp. WMMD998]
MREWDAAPEAVASDVVASLGRCDRELGDFATGVTLDYDFGPDSGLYPHLILSTEQDGVQQADIRKTIRMPISLHPFLSNEISIRLTLGFTPSACRVTSVIEVHLDQPMGTFAAGSHILYHRASEGLPLAEALRAAEAHVRDLYRVATFPETLGLPARE